MLAGTVAASAVGSVRGAPTPPGWESLATSYRLPDWFRDAKFGIWAARNCRSAEMPTRCGSNSPLPRQARSSG